MPSLSSPRLNSQVLRWADLTNLSSGTAATQCMPDFFQLDVQYSSLSELVPLVLFDYRTLPLLTWTVLLSSTQRATAELSSSLHASVY